VIEAVTGQPWQVALEERITRPLGLHDDPLRSRRGSHRQPRMPYTMGPDGVTPGAKRSTSARPAAPAGWSDRCATSARWAQALHHGQVVSAASYAR
jgi:CubicO group peptidase (beta-lactamase class C family)